MAWAIADIFASNQSIIYNLQRNYKKMYDENHIIKKRRKPKHDIIQKQSARHSSIDIGTLLVLRRKNENRIVYRRTFFIKNHLGVCRKELHGYNK